MNRYPLNILDGTAHAWRHHLQEWRSCMKCNIGLLAHEHVFARGNLPCDILFIGEGPGRTEDAVGKPFIGAAGQILVKWIKKALEETIEWDAVRTQSLGAGGVWSYAITNLVLCRPTDRVGGPNREPSDQEVDNCSSRLRHFIAEIARPKGIVLLGRVPAKHWARATWNHDLYQPYLKLIHPAALLHNQMVGGRRDQEECQKLTNFVKEILDA
jgi:uracil-DNA glycosylase